MIVVRYFVSVRFSETHLKDSNRFQPVFYFFHSLLSFQMHQFMRSFMKLVMFYQYFSKKLKLKGHPFVLRRHQSQAIKIVLFQITFMLTSFEQNYQKAVKFFFRSFSSSSWPTVVLFLSNQLVSFRVFLKKGIQKSLSLFILFKTTKQLTTSFQSSCCLFCFLVPILPNNETSSFSISPKIVPLVLFMKIRPSSNDLIPEKSNFIVIAAISLIIFDILRVFSSSICRWELLVWSKSFIKDLSSRILTLNFSSALAKCRTLSIFFSSTTLSAINSYFSLHFWICLRFQRRSSWLTDSYMDFDLRHSQKECSMLECLAQISFCMFLEMECLSEVSFIQTLTISSWGRHIILWWKNWSAESQESKRELRCGSMMIYFFQFSIDYQYLSMLIAKSYKDITWPTLAPDKPAHHTFSACKQMRAFSPKQSGSQVIV